MQCGLFFLLYEDVLQARYSFKPVNPKIQTLFYSNPSNPDRKKSTPTQKVTPFLHPAITTLILLYLQSMLHKNLKILSHLMSKTPPPSSSPSSTGPPQKSIPKYKTFNNKSYAWKPDIDYRLHPQLYKVGKGEQGVLLCQPYKGEILKYWRFKTPEIAVQSSQEIYKLFEKYLEDGEFVGADMARKFLQMGFTRSRRYANYKGGLKYSKETGEQLQRGTGQEEKAESASIFYEKWQQAERNQEYRKRKAEWRAMYG